MSYTAKDIKILKDLEPVRLRPGMYIGNTGRQGLNHLVQEMIDNAVDEALAGYCHNIYVSINKDGSATIEDDGRGVPIDMHESGVPAERVIYTVLHAGGKFNNSTYKISGGLHGVGSAVVNALTEHLYVDVYKNGYVHHDSYSRGVPVTKLVDGALPKEKLKEKKTGTKVTLYPDPDIFEVTKFKASAIRQRLKETAYLNPGLNITYENMRDNEEKENFCFPDGLTAFVEDISRDLTKLTPVIEVKGENSGIEADCVFVLTEDGEENIYGFTNNISNPDGGSHIAGFKTGFTKLINQYARNELKILKEKDKNFGSGEVLKGAQVIVSIRHPDPQFEGQTKTKLGSIDAGKAVEAIIMEQLTLYFDRNYEVLKDIADRASELTRQKANAKNKVRIDSFSFEGNGKLTKQESNKAEECEIFIVEGDSAGGTAKTARNRRTQAILPLRGKILNIEKQPVSKILQNAEIKSMINAFGCGFGSGEYGQAFDINKLNYDKIIIMTDADVDGAHIATLLLTFFFRCFPQLIQEGHVYIAMPPLYKVGSGKKEKYLYSDEELEKYRKTHKNFPLQRYKGLGEMDADQLYETTMNPETRLMKKVHYESMIEANLITQTLMGTDVEPRKKYIEKHGSNAFVDM